MYRAIKPVPESIVKSVVERALAADVGTLVILYYLAPQISVPVP